MNIAQRLRHSRGTFGSVFVALLIVGGLAGLARADRALAQATLSVRCGTPTSFATIQDAVNAATDAGDTIRVCLGTPYAEQVVIPATKSNLTLVSQTPYSQSSTGAIIQAPANLPSSPSAIVHVSGATGVTISGFTISGPAPPVGQGAIGYGVLLDGGGSLTLKGNRITAIRDDPLTGAQNGWAVRAISSTLTATGNVVDDYQKNGIDVRGPGAVGTITGNTVIGAGETTLIGQNGIVVVGGARGIVSGNTVSGNIYRGKDYPDVLATGIIVVGPGGGVTVSDNRLLSNDIGILVAGATGAVTATANTTRGGDYGIYVDESSSVVIEKNVSDAATTVGLYAGKDANSNTFQDNIAKGVPLPGHDCRDDSSGSATSNTANTWTNNIGDTRSPDGICAKAPIKVDIPPVIVLPPAGTPLPPGTVHPGPKPGGPIAQKAADEIITKMNQNQLRSCVVEVRSLGTKRILVARGVARASATGTGRMVIRLGIKPKGTKLLTKNFGGVIVDVRALCRSTSGVLHAGVKRVRAVLWIEHALTPPGSWVPDQPILTDTGLRFMQKLRSHLVFSRLIKCEGYTATYPPSPAFPPTLSLNRAKRVCNELKGVAAATKARVKLVPHGLTDPIATNSNEAGRRVNRRVFVTIVHFRVLPG